MARVESCKPEMEDGLAWTLAALARHLFRQRSARVLLTAYLFLLLWVQSPRVLGSSINRVFLGAGTIEASWSRWLVYTWLILAALRIGKPGRSRPLRPPHFLESGSMWFAIRWFWEGLILWLVAECLLWTVSWACGAVFHVELWQVSVNLCLCLAACGVWILLASAFRNSSVILISLGLAVGLWEWLLLYLPKGWDRSQLGISVLLIAMGLLLALNPMGMHRCKSQS